MEDLEREDRRPERRSEEDGEGGGHPADGEDAHLVPPQAAPPAGVGPDDTACLDERCLRTESAAGGDPEQRDREQGSQRSDVVAAAVDVDVVDQQLHVTRIPEQLDEHTDGNADGDEGRDLPHRCAVVLRRQEALQQTQDADVGGADGAPGQADSGNEQHRPPVQVREVRMHQYIV